MVTSSTLGAVLDGAIVSTMLYGVSIGQTYRYFKAYPDDDIRLKTVVTILFMLDGIQECFIIHALWYFLVQKCEGHSPSKCYVWSYTAFPVPSQLVIFIVQCFYLRRIWAFGKRKLVYILLVGAILELFLGFGVLHSSFCPHPNAYNL
ncbi:hypothetical protein NEOLEDRAFT_830758 [Neolentinus lepideus HHB14362 ss-1]|uniref:Uncharacterized protein n=1 Tax=Neolentinus lepideus HHB14362 ss-1 TaxID=1314782 RepID=A0A165P9G1_9AGAM|nr:hypothetical protein NEOLEDRAFT_830758 [Neolentinus lepideus HHB14362 ss-1]